MKKNYSAITFVLLSRDNFYDFKRVSGDLMRVRKHFKIVWGMLVRTLR